MKYIDIARKVLSKDTDSFDYEMAEYIIRDKPTVIRRLLDEDYRLITCNIIYMSCKHDHVYVIDHMIDKKFYNNSGYYIYALRRAVKEKNEDIINYIIKSNTFKYVYYNDHYYLVVKIIPGCENNVFKQLIDIGLVTKDRLQDAGLNVLDDMLTTRNFEKLAIIITKGELGMSKMVNILLGHKDKKNVEDFVKYFDERYTIINK